MTADEPGGVAPRRRVGLDDGGGPHDQAALAAMVVVGRPIRRGPR